MEVEYGPLRKACSCGKGSGNIQERTFNYRILQRRKKFGKESEKMLQNR
jgi:hypothetical protein